MSDPRPTRFPRRIVGIGASAGGLEALERFFDHMPADTGMAFVVVQHLSPDFRSLMDELLARHTQLPIRLVEDGMVVEADHVYLIPPKKEMIISGGRLLLSERDQQHELSLPIDIFFRSLAQDCGRRAVAVVLSGGGTDGSRGVRDIDAAGGLVIVQSLETAQFDGMPRTAHDSGVAKWVLAPADMPRVLIEHAAKELPSSDGPADDAAAANGLGTVYRMLQDEFGIDFTDYKPSTVTRRIERRLALARSSDLGEYVRRLQSERKELDVLYRDLLIGVTRFFRDEEAFALLEQRVLPELLLRHGRDVPLRFWLAGCATGEEAYSLAILLADLMSKLGERQIKIFATDVHRGSLDHATRAIYDEAAVARVSPDRLARYFTRSGDMYQVVPELRQMIVFAQHNVIKDAPFTRVDLISCRNLLIYLQPAAQQKVLSLFHFALKRDGLMFLGPSETAGPLGRAFDTVDKHWRIYRKRSDARVPIDTRIGSSPRGDLRPAAGSDLSAPALSAMVSGVGSPVGSSAGSIVGSIGGSIGGSIAGFTFGAGSRYSLSQLLGTYDALLEDMLPPSFLVNERGEVVHAFSGASRFLRLRDGRQDLGLLDLVGPELRMVLVGGIKRAFSEAGATVYRNVRIADGEGDRLYTVTIRRVSGHGGASHLLISLDETGVAAPVPDRTETEIELDQVSREQLKTLESELSHTKESLQSAIEELETSNEELQASNEELQTSNEELQSTNEELQSVNEELYTVNAEYQRKISELTELMNDMDNLLASTEVGTIFLDSQLRIRKFTPHIAEVFNLVPHDVGRSLDTFAQKMDYPGLADDIRRVGTSGTVIERELRDVRGRTMFMRILPYRAKGKIDGVVVTVIDVTGLKAAEDALFHERYLLNSLVSSVSDAIYFKDANGRLIRVNAPMAKRIGISDPAQAVGKTAFELPNQSLATVLQREDDAVLRSGEAQHYKLERRAGDGGAESWDLVTRLPLRDSTGAIVGIIVMFRDVTQQKLAEDKIQESVRRRDQFLAMLSHELRNPLGAMVTATSLLRSDGATGPRTDRLIGILERQSRQMTRLLDDLLEASRVTQNKIELKRRIVDLTAVAKEAAEAVRAQMEGAGLEFASDISQEPVYVDADPARLQQIQVNLLSNAAKYTHRGGKVVLSVGREDQMAVIRVRDNGAGIPREMIDSVFDLFVQSTRTLDRAAGGLGLGLTLVRSLAAMHGGTVTVHSDGEGQGSEFVVRLPRAATPKLDLSEISKARPSVSERAKVVVVEDNADSREMLCELLADAGLDCRAAENGSAGLVLLREFRPDIAILDVGLPTMDGFELARRIRAEPALRQMWLIALTGYGQASDRAASRDAGFDEHLVKPIHPDQLLNLLAEMREARARIQVIDERTLGPAMLDGMPPVAAWPQPSPAKRAQDADGNGRGDDRGDDEDPTGTVREPVLPSSDA